MVTRLREVWYGQRSLAETYWGWGIIGTIAGYLLAVITVAAGMSIGRPIIGFALCFVLVIPISVFLFVANWRSASNNPGFWATIVKIVVVIQVIYLVIEFGMLFTGALNPGAPQS